MYIGRKVHEKGERGVGCEKVLKIQVKNKVGVCTIGWQREEASVQEKTGLHTRPVRGLQLKIQFSDGMGEQEKRSRNLTQRKKKKV